MEKHPIDSRFKDGLGGFTPQPSSDAWARLQSRMAEEAAPEVAEEEPQKKRFIMWYSIAAAITFLLISVGLYRVNFQSGKTNLVATTTKPAQTGTDNLNEGTTKIAEAQAEVIAPENETLLAQQTKKTETEKPEYRTEPVTANTSIISIPKQYSKAEKTAKRIAPVQSENQIASAKKPEMKKPVNEAPVSENKNLKNETLLAANTPEKTETAQPASTGKLPENVLEVVVIRNEPAVVLASAQPVNETKDKTELVKNIFKQARNLKNGEKVDFRKIGIEPDSKLAMETRNIKQNITQTFTKVLEL